jgi:DNA polymerase-3 subunit alpha
LKANFPEEFLTAYLNVEIGRSNYDKVDSLEKMAKDMNIEILSRQINLCKVDYSILKKADPANGIPRSQIIPSLRCKGLSSNAAKNIVENQPYSSLQEFAEKTDTRIVDIKSFESLLNAGFFRPAKGGGRSAKKEEILKTFEIIRDDLKRAKKKGVIVGNIFG